MQANPLRPLIFMPSEPHTPSRQDLRSVNELSRLSLIYSSASSSILPAGAISTSKDCR
ncbi:hypothetical protein GALL_508810 [mine drainage metagenome]|uniref:Uncharacterized protein n=1 Tax=mine drainage metagenome TaxID=410659 RepID=A0A1J5PJ26_9ZZZZ